MKGMGAAGSYAGRGVVVVVGSAGHLVSGMIGAVSYHPWTQWSALVQSDGDVGQVRGLVLWLSAMTQQAGGR